MLRSGVKRGFLRNVGVEVKLLDTFPHYEELGPPEIIAMGGFGTISADDFLEMYRSLSPQEVKERVEKILHQAIVRGYASMTTSTAVAFAIKGSRIMDLFLTAFPFGSYMVLSQRYVPVERPEVPSWVSKEVESLVMEEIKVYKEMVDLGLRREEARGVLGLGTPSHMIAVLNVESVANLKRWEGDHPEIRELLKALEKEMLSSDLAPLYKATINAPTMGGPFPHPFHWRELKTSDDLTVSSYQWSGSCKGVEEFKKELNRIRGDPPKNWKELVNNTVRLSKVSFENVNEFWVTLEGRVPLTLFNELKRHRTVPLEVEGIYRALERSSFYIYPSVKNNKEALRMFNWIVDEFRGLEVDHYQKVYALPQSIKLGVRFTLNFAQLTAPSLFYRMRSCDRAEVSMKQLVRKIPYLIKSAVPDYGEKLFQVLTSEINGSRIPLPKCVVGACPEPDFCPLVKGINARYTEEVHKVIKKSRKEVLR